MTPTCSDIPQALSLDPFPSLAVSTAQTSALHSSQVSCSVKHQLPTPTPAPGRTWRGVGKGALTSGVWEFRGLYQVLGLVALPCTAGKETLSQRMSHLEAGPPNAHITGRSH